MSLMGRALHLTRWRRPAGMLRTAVGEGLAGRRPARADAYLHDGQALRARALDELLESHLPGETAIVVVNGDACVGARLHRRDVSAFVAPFVLTAEIQISDPSHSCCIAVPVNGFAAG